jgi:PAS domain S-box-containing protein
LVIEDNTFVDCNKAVVKMLGYKNKKELLNTHPSELSPEKQPDGRYSFEKAQEMIALAIKNGSNHFEWIHTRANGENFPVEVWLSSFKFKNKTLINTIWRDLTEKKKAEQIILKNIEEKETLLKEIHHRVKNNLQIISSLLNLQSNSVNDAFVSNILNQSKARIESMCKVHEMLYKSDNLSQINYEQYLIELVTKLIQNLKGNNCNILLDIKAPVSFNINTAIPLGLLINEIITNSLKYGIQNNSKGKIYILIKKLNKNKFSMVIGDNGKGFPKSISINNSPTLGFQLIITLTEQINGSCARMHNKKGTHYNITFEEI